MKSVWSDIWTSTRWLSASTFTIIKIAWWSFSNTWTKIQLLTSFKNIFRTIRRTSANTLCIRWPWAFQRCTTKMCSIETSSLKTSSAPRMVMSRSLTLVSPLYFRKRLTKGRLSVEMCHSTLLRSLKASNTPKKLMSGPSAASRTSWPQASLLSRKWNRKLSSWDTS